MRVVGPFGPGGIRASGILPREAPSSSPCATGRPLDWPVAGGSGFPTWRPLPRLLTSCSGAVGDINFFSADCDWISSCYPLSVVSLSEATCSVRGTAASCRRRSCRDGRWYYPCLEHPPWGAWLVPELGPAPGRDSFLPPSPVCLSPPSLVARPCSHFRLSFGSPPDPGAG